MPNQLANEKSLYLRQHADNPVDWRPWGEEALAKAKAEDKPLLISIGYSSCHWCHVMEHESFENPYIAQLMNEHFICVKVDREERPDVDQIYMEAVMMITQRGGWPLNVFCLPDGRPFFGGTYFPPEDRGGGMVPWPQVLIRVSDFYKRNRDQLEENAENIVKNMMAANTPLAAVQTAIDQTLLLKTSREFTRRHDENFGGFGPAPKFPPSMAINYLMQVRQGWLKVSEKEAEDNPAIENIDFVINTTLTAMARGGIFDQIGGGFARYSVDAQWTIPHFEKMLYDNGLLLDTYARACLTYGEEEPLYKAIVDETATWALREMRSENGGFYSAFDADSEGEEGKFYVWKPEEIIEVLGQKEGELFCRAYDITPHGNFEHGYSNPTIQAETTDTRESLASARAKLYQHRKGRIPPALDKKQLTSWNSLMMRGLAEAGFVLDRPDLFAAARSAADFIWDNARSPDDRLYAVHYDVGTVNAYLDDYAFYAEALLSIAAYADIFNPGQSKRYLNRCEAIAKATLTHFKDPAAVGFYFTSHDHESLINRKKEWWDSSIPAGNSSMLHVLSSLYYLTLDPHYRDAFQELRRAYSGMIARNPSGIPHALGALMAESNGIEVIKVKDVSNLDDLAAVLRRQPWVKRYCLLSDEPDQPPGYQRCIGPTCLLPVSTPDLLFPSRT